MKRVYILRNEVHKLFNLSAMELKSLNISQSMIVGLITIANESYAVMTAGNYTDGNNNNNNNYSSRFQGCDVCDTSVLEWVNMYAEIHGHLSIVVCIFGTVANMLNIAVLTRKDMVCAPINRILTGLAVADMMLMIEYMTFAYYYHMELPQKLNFPFWAAAFMLFHIHFSQVLHTVSICLTLALAVWRYLAIGYPDKNHILCSERRCTLAISLSYILPIILCSPMYFAFEIKSTQIEEDKIYILYHTSLSDIATSNDTYLVFNFWMYAVVIKLIPCLILTVITAWLIRTLCKAKKRKQVLRGYDICPTSTTTGGGAAAAAASDALKKKTKSERRADRTTKMLVAVLSLFLITEFPQGIFGLLSGMKGKCFFLQCYQAFGDIMDMLALLNGSINFILYCCMNRMFRATFGQLFRHKILAKWAPPVQSDVHTTGASSGTNTTEM